MIFDKVNYNKELNDISNKIKKYFDFSVVRGNGVSSFVFAEKGKRAIEIYQSENSVIVEFWENKESTSLSTEVHSFEEAADLAIKLVSKYENRISF